MGCRLSRTQAFIHHIPPISMNALQMIGRSRISVAQDQVARLVPMVIRLLTASMDTAIPVTCKFGL